MMWSNNGQHWRRWQWTPERTERRMWLLPWAVLWFSSPLCSEQKKLGFFCVLWGCDLLHNMHYVVPCICQHRKLHCGSHNWLFPHISTLNIFSFLVSYNLLERRVCDSIECKLYFTYRRYRQIICNAKKSCDSRQKTKTAVLKGQKRILGWEPSPTTRRCRQLLTVTIFQMKCQLDSAVCIALHGLILILVYYTYSHKKCKCFCIFIVMHMNAIQMQKVK